MLDSFTLTQKNDQLYEAISKGSLEDVEHLLEDEMVQNSTLIRNGDALYRAVCKGHLDIFYRLLEIQSVQNSADSKNNQTLCAAARKGHAEMVNRLLEIDKVAEMFAIKNNQAFCMAAENGHINIVNRFLEFEEVARDIAANKNEAFCLAVESGCLSVVIRLLEYSDVINNITQYHNSTFLVAYYEKYHDVIAYLMQFDEVRRAILAEDNLDENLRALAQDKENAIQALKQQGLQFSTTESSNSRSPADALTERFSNMQNMQLDSKKIDDLESVIYASGLEPPTRKRYFYGLGKPSCSDFKAMTEKEQQSLEAYFERRFSVKCLLESRVLQFSTTESNPDPLAERFSDMQLDSEGFDDLAPPKKKRKLS